MADELKRTAPANAPEPSPMTPMPEYRKVEGEYTAEDLHPPLARVFGVLGPHFAGARWSGDTNSWYEGFRQLGHDEHYVRTLALGRMGILPFFWLGAAVVF